MSHLSSFGSFSRSSSFGTRNRFRRGGMGPFHRSDSPMSDDEVRRYAPSVFAEGAASRTSERYAFIPTSFVLQGLRDNGWGVFAVAEQRVRTDDRLGFQKHLLRLRRLDGASIARVGDSIPELLLTNSHDGTSAYKLHAALFRLICSNGMVVSDRTFDKVSVRHSGNVRDAVVDASFRVIDAVPQVAASVDSMRSLILTPGEQEIFAGAALQLRWGQDEQGRSTAPVSPAAVNVARRHADAGADLWSTFNRLQENLSNGGLRGRNANNGRTTTRPVNGIDANTKLNTALWTLAEEMRKLKGAA